MKASDLLGQDVINDRGERVGIVTDLRCIDDGRRNGRTHDLRIDGLVVSGRHTGSMLGYSRPGQRGPWLVRAVVRALHRRLTVIPWHDVADSDGPIVLRSSANRQRT